MSAYRLPLQPLLRLRVLVAGMRLLLPGRRQRVRGVLVPEAGQRQRAPGGRVHERRRELGGGLVPVGLLLDRHHRPRALPRHVLARCVRAPPRPDMTLLPLLPWRRSMSVYACCRPRPRAVDRQLRDPPAVGARRVQQRVHQLPLGLQPARVAHLPHPGREPHGERYAPPSHTHTLQTSVCT